MGPFIRTALASAISATAGLALMAAPATAATETSVNYCSVRPANPYITTYNGVRYAEANVYVYCSRSRSGIANAQIKEADYGTDDAVSGLGSFSFSLTAGQTMKVGTVRGRCLDFDSVGLEELYNHARINVGGINSSWADTGEVSATC